MLCAATATLAATQYGNGWSAIVLPSWTPGRIASIRGIYPTRVLSSDFANLRCLPISQEI
ncbi:uncharacterized protein EKO05_0008721 [Ascochyta rabiei]|uniref:uncharacterized protein n=1 Tax=Didymella rabiei TaxID=5454 RepID=UPI0021FEA044|nr:uncharacterized protein EKO05_0008721 [Ascochyta rabiei]UPX18421.1 hypothetical protein EKO05_0008721 [Ascochyta rabiei]